MPHVVLEGRVTIDEAGRRFEPFVVRERDLVIKAERFYRERDGRAALVEMVVVGPGHTQRFFIQLAPRQDGLTVRLEPLTDPEKTPGVRRAIARVAHRLAAATGARYGNTNIEDDLIR
ncbi:MAG TPA: hypothetical protein VEO94_08850 [Candidatus Dormibacteraeota bacterium]|nr:hypothetical protein [Candidatus Dormibacteraeota bacterium]